MINSRDCFVIILYSLRLRTMTESIYGLLSFPSSSMIMSRASLWTLHQKFLRPLKAFSCILCTYTCMWSRSITSPHPYLVPSWNDPRVARKFDKLCLQMFILTRSTKRDVASTSYSFSPLLFLQTQWNSRAGKVWSRPFLLLEEISGIGRVGLFLPPRRFFTLELDIRFFIMDVLDAIRFDRSSIKTVFLPYSNRHALPSLKHVCAFKPSKYRRTITMQK